MGFNVASVLVPLKFIVVLGQLSALILILITKDAFIFAGLPQYTEYGSSDYDAADAELKTCCAIFMAVLIPEFFSLFMAISIRTHQLNLFQILFHLFGGTCSTWYILSEWHYKTLWYIFAFFGIIPCFLESVMLIRLICKARKLKAN